MKRDSPLMRLKEDFKELDREKAASQPPRIYFKDLHSEIQERKAQINSLQASQNRLIEIDERGKLTVGAENKGRVHDLATKLKQLREQNDIEGALLEKSKEISSRFNIDFSELHLLHLSIPMLERQIGELNNIIDESINISPERIREKGNIHSELGQKFEMINRAREALSNHKQAQKEINLLIGGTL